MANLLMKEFFFGEGFAGMISRRAELYALKPGMSAQIRKFGVIVTPKLQEKMMGHGR